MMLSTTNEDAMRHLHSILGIESFCALIILSHITLTSHRFVCYLLLCLCLLVVPCLEPPDFFTKPKCLIVFRLQKPARYFTPADIFSFITNTGKLQALYQGPAILQVLGVALMTEDSWE